MIFLILLTQMMVHLPIDDAYKTSRSLKIKTISYKNSVIPWISENIINFFKKRHHYFILFRKSLISKATFSNLGTKSPMKFVKPKQYFKDKFNEVKNEDLMYFKDPRFFNLTPRVL